MINITSWKNGEVSIYWVGSEREISREEKGGMTEHNSMGVCLSKAIKTLNHKAEHRHV